MMNYHSRNSFDNNDYSKFAFKKSELLAVLHAIDKNFSFEIVTPSEPSREIVKEELADQMPLHIKILAMNYFFTVTEAACFISLDEPEQMQALINSGDLNYDAWRYGEHIQAVKVIEGGIKANKLDIDNDGSIPRASLQLFLFELNKVIVGFNDNLPVPTQVGCGTPMIGHATPEHYQKQRDNLLKENEQLKNELVEAQERIKQIEIERQNNSPQPTLLDLIFDENAQGRYAPDLVLSIKLWESLYINNPKDDSHKNKSDNWIKTNTPYKNLDSVEFKRLREITSPFEAWHNERKNKFIRK